MRPPRSHSPPLRPPCGQGLGSVADVLERIVEKHRARPTIQTSSLSAGAPGESLGRADRARRAAARLATISFPPGDGGRGATASALIAEVGPGGSISQLRQPLCVPIRNRGDSLLCCLGCAITRATHHDDGGVNSGDSLSGACRCVIVSQVLPKRDFGKQSKT
jgi:hypothetical protein